MAEVTKMWIYLHDLNLRQKGQVVVEVQGKPRVGPGDENLTIVESDVRPDADGNYVDSQYSYDELDAIHAFAAARLTIDLWEGVTGKRLVDSPRSKSRLPIRMFLNAPISGAKYRPSKRSIYFGTLGSDQGRTCRSFDIVSHEVTHAILHSYLPKARKSIYLDRLAIIESLADVTPIFVLLRIPSVAMRVRDPNFKWEEPSILSEFAEGFGDDRLGGVRSALAPPRLAYDRYSASEVLTAHIFKLISNLRHSRYTSDELARRVFTKFLDRQPISIKSFAAQLQAL